MRPLTRRLLVTPAAAALAVTGLVNPVSSPAVPLPPGTTPVTVTAGMTQSGIDASLHRGGAIAGRVTLKSSNLPARWATVVAVRAPRESTSTGAPATYVSRTGTYQISRLAPGDYYVCAYPAAHHYVAQCLGTTDPPASGSRPSTATAVHVQAGRTTTADLALPDGGAISGTVRATNGRDPLSGVRVQVYLSGHLIRSALTNREGSYRVSGLLGGHSYRVCFNTLTRIRAAGATTSPTGYLSRCWQQVPWWPRDEVPSDAAPVRVHSTATTLHVNALLPQAAAIAGTVRSDLGTHPGIDFSHVSVYRAGELTRSTNSYHGRFRFAGLAPGQGYTVCARGGFVHGWPVYGGQCWKDIPWDGGPVPNEAEPITITPKTTTHGIDLFESDRTAGYGNISGNVTFDAHPVSWVAIYVFHNGSYLADTTGEDGPYHTDADGNYNLGWLPAGADYQICFDPSYYAAGWPSFPPTGYAATCYGDAPWAGPGTPVPANTQTVSVQRGQTTTAVDAELGLGGTITGTVTHNGHSVTLVNVYAIDSAGHLVRASASTNDHGRYKITGLLPTDAGYTICFATRWAKDTAGDLHGTGLVNQCYNDQPWTWWSAGQ